MDNADTLKMLIKEYRRKVRDAADDVSKGQSQLFDFERKLEAMENYRAECKQGFSSIPSSAFFYAQRRECRLLLEHLDEVLHEHNERVRACLKYIEKNTDLGTKYKQRLEQCEAQLEALVVADEDTTAKKMPVSGSVKPGAYSWIKVGKNI